MNKVNKVNKVTGAQLARKRERNGVKRKRERERETV